MRFGRIIFRVSFVGRRFGTHSSDMGRWPPLANVEKITNEKENGDHSKRIEARSALSSGAGSLPSLFFFTEFFIVHPRRRSVNYRQLEQPRQSRSIIQDPFSFLSRFSG